MDDPTLTFLASLNDPRKYRVTRNVPIFAAHKRRTKDRDGTERIIEVTEADLGDIAATMARLERETGQPARITLGHTNPDPHSPEPMQPEPVGYARSPRVGKWGPKGRLAILVDQYLAVDCLARIGASYPYRSAEYYHGRKEITGIALLRRDPELDLGVVHYARREPFYLYSVEAPSMDPTQMPDAKDPDQEFMDRCDRYMSARYPEMAKMYTQYMATMAAPSPTNLPVPGANPAPTPAPSPEPDEDEKKNYQRQAQAQHYAKLEQELAMLRQESNIAKGQAIVATLQNEGFLIRDVAKEVQRFARLDDAGRAERADEIRANYQRDPAKHPEIPVGEIPGQRKGKYTLPNGELSRDGVDAVLRYQQDHAGMTWDAARAAILAQ